MAETQNHGHETSPKIPKLEHYFSWDESIPEITSFFRVHKLSERAIFPSRASFLSAGYDLSSSADIIVPARSQAWIPTDLGIVVSQGTYAQIAPRPGLTWNRWIEVGSWVFAADYKGLVWVILINHSDVDFQVKMGYTIAQLIIQKIMNPEVTWTMGEEKCLAKACVTVGNDPKVASPQKSRDFWQITTVCYNENRPVGTSAREWTSLKSHYYQILFDVLKFSGWYDNLFNNRARGESDADVLAATHDRWKMEHKNKVFKYEHVWKIIIECTKSAPQSLGRHIDKKAKTSESRTHNFSINPDADSDADADSEIRAHPIEQQKVEGKIEAEVTEDEIVNEKWEQMQQYRMEKLMLREAEIKQKEIELKQRDYDILMKDTRDMTETQLHWHTKIVELIAARRDLK